MANHISVRTDNISAEAAINKGVYYLKNHQYPNGEFCCYFSPDDAMQEWCVPDSTVFPTAIINTCLLAASDRPEVQSIFKKSIPFFQYQMMRGGVVNYFTKWNPLFPLAPPDIDDTIFVYNFLRSQNTDTPNPIPLISSNRSKQGLYYTWFTLRPRANRNKHYWLIILREFKNPIKSLVFWRRNDCKRNDIDAVVNSNILASLDEESQKSVITFLIDTIDKKMEAKCDSWYQNPFTLYYSLSCNISKGVIGLRPIIDTVKDRVLSHRNKDGSIGTSALDTAFAITTLLNLGQCDESVRDAVSFLIDNQQSTGEWPRQIFFYSGPKKAVGWGSEELTTAFCIEALSKYQQSIAQGL
jgi:hypothetical protein